MNTLGFPDDSVGKEATCNAEGTADARSIPRSGRSLGGGKWQSTPVFLTGKSHGQRNLAAYSPWGRKESDMTERLNTKGSLRNSFHFWICSVSLVMLTLWQVHSRQWLSVSSAFSLQPPLWNWMVLRVLLFPQNMHKIGSEEEGKGRVIVSIFSNNSCHLQWWPWFSRKVESNSCDPMDCSPPGFSVHGILQARTLEWIAISSSRGSSPPRD